MRLVIELFKKSLAFLNKLSYFCLNYVYYFLLRSIFRRTVRDVYLNLDNILENENIDE